ncbi:maleylpyruvate isomerase family mycothiol-dependent enzyme [Pseudonocardia sp. RS11V-5]|uniref:maleylpyruvate isomerase family mycothiol-dependent enzyme n=1 Tax=Pseudonocardia terrae TaxID=2905831 RepID=UPI001E4C5EE3|nr:maleylpyruvate isomerase family mycothiol-dependent enzyme [Pseudonocardia terrae]MCE3551894.1 maleylpyruvate isomerase family mycothiol-dependent enzyme [Pseudonocardia terrae]
MTRTLELSLAWAGDGAAHLRGLMDRMGDEAFQAPSALPGWTRAHVLSHVARNAEAMMNLLHWARTGEETPAYADDTQRDADIATGAQRDPAAIREDVVATSDKLAQVVKAMPEEAWSRSIRDRQGREVPATEIAWMRAREMWIHSVDLDVGASFEDFPQPMLCELVADVAANLAARPGTPAVRLVAGDRDQAWTTAAEGTSPALSVEAPVADLAEWVSGRGRSRRIRAVTPEGEPTQVPELPAWL